MTVLVLFIILVVWLTVASIGFRVCKDKFDGFSITFAFFALLYLGRAVLIRLGLDEPFPEYLFSFDTLPYQNTMDLAISAFVLTSALTFSLSRHATRNPLLFLHPRVPDVISFPRLFTIICFMFAVSIGLILSAIIANDFDLAATAWAIRIDKYFSGVAFLQVLGSLVGYLSVPLAISYHRQKVTSGEACNWFIVVLLVFMGFLGTASTMLMGERDQFIFWVLFCIACWSIYVRRIGTITIAVSGIGGIAYMTISQILRREVWGGAYDPISLWRAVSSGLNLDVYDKFILIVRLWEYAPLRWGADFVTGLLGIIPRAVWPDKPQDLHPGTWLRAMLEGDIPGGWPFTPVGEWWINFGWFGVLCGGVISGLIISAYCLQYKDYRLSPFGFMYLYLFATRIFLLGYSATTPLVYFNWIVPIALVLLVSSTGLRRPENTVSPPH